MLIQWHELQEHFNGLGLDACINSLNLNTSVHMYDICCILGLANIREKTSVTNGMMEKADQTRLG